LDSTIKNITFDCFVLNRYGNYDKIAPYTYLHANVKNIHGLGTIIIVATPLWVKWKDETPTPKVGDLESPRLPNV
jgi:hypothetical protein